MYLSINNTNVFINSLGSVGRIKKGWQNYPTGSPIKGHQIQPNPPPTLI